MIGNHLQMYNSLPAYNSIRSPLVENRGQARSREARKDLES